jgi:DNA-directed RNA polymerase specialized sigma24 family protein
MNAVGVCLRGHRLDETPVAQIAEHLGKKQKAVAMLLYRGMSRLRELLAEPDGSAAKS